MRTSEHATRASSAVVSYVVILVAFQVCLLTVAVEAFAHERDEERAFVERAGVGAEAAEAEVARWRGDETVALWSAARHVDIFEQAFGIPLELVAVPEE